MKDVIIERKERAWKEIKPAHATRDKESLFYGLTIDEANELKKLIPEGRITGESEIFSSRQFKFPYEFPSGMVIIEDGKKVDLWLEYKDQRIIIRIKI